MTQGRENILGPKFFPFIILFYRVTWIRSEFDLNNNLYTDKRKSTARRYSLCYTAAYCSDLAATKPQEVTVSGCVVLRWNALLVHFGLNKTPVFCLDTDTNTEELNKYLMRPLEVSLRVGCTNEQWLWKQYSFLIFLKFLITCLCNRWSHMNESILTNNNSPFLLSSTLPPALCRCFPPTERLAVVTYCSSPTFFIHSTSHCLHGEVISCWSRAWN